MPCEKCGDDAGDVDLNLLQYRSKVGFARGRRIMSLLDQVHGFR